MAGGKNKIQEHPNRNTNGFDKRPEDINKKGPPNGFAGFTPLLRELMENDGKMIVECEVAEIVKNGEEWEETGNVFEAARIEIPAAFMLVYSIAMKAVNGNLNAAKFLWERIEGKAEQPIKHKGENGETGIGVFKLGDQIVSFGNKKEE